MQEDEDKRIDTLLRECGADVRETFEARAGAVCREGAKRAAAAARTRGAARRLGGLLPGFNAPQWALVATALALLLLVPGAEQDLPLSSISSSGRSAGQSAASTAQSGAANDTQLLSQESGDGFDYVSLVGALDEAAAADAADAATEQADDEIFPTLEEIASELDGSLVEEEIYARTTDDSIEEEEIEEL